MRTKLILFYCGLCLGLVLGFAASKYLFQSVNWHIRPKQKEPEGIACRFFPDMTISDIYKDEKVLDILRNPGSVIICERWDSGDVLEVGGFRFSSKGKAMKKSDADMLSICFRSMNSLEVGLGYPCSFDPKFLIRFKSRSGYDMVDFLFGKNCYLVDWYYNLNPVTGATSRVKMSPLGISLMESMRERYALENNLQILPE